MKTSFPRWSRMQVLQSSNRSWRVRARFCGAHSKCIDNFTVSAEEYDRVMSVNARGVMLCYRYAALQMVKQKRGGRILGASSILGREGNNLYPPTRYQYSRESSGKAASAMGYVASKFAVRGLTQALCTCHYFLHYIVHE